MQEMKEKLEGHAEVAIRSRLAELEFQYKKKKTLSEKDYQKMAMV